MKRSLMFRAMAAFARPLYVDLSIYRDLLVHGGFDTIVELGSGTGRLAAPLSRDVARFVAVERDPDLRAVQIDQCALGRSSVLSDLQHLSKVDGRAALIAPYNVAYYFSTPDSFADCCATAFRSGVEAILYDIDDVGEQERSEQACGGLELDAVASSRNIASTVRCAAGFEEVATAASRSVLVRWCEMATGVTAGAFRLRLHTPRELEVAIMKRLPGAQVTSLTSVMDERGRPIKFCEVKL